MSSNSNRFTIKNQVQTLYGVLLEVRTDNKLHVIPSDNLSVKDPQGLKTILDMLASAISIMAEVRLMGLEGEGKEVLKDALMCHVNSIKSLVAKYLPQMEGKLIEVSLAGPVRRLQG